MKTSELEEKSSLSQFLWKLRQASSKNRNITVPEPAIWSICKAVLEKRRVTRVCVWEVTG